MPWTCKGCSGEVGDSSLACPTCGQQKTSWTIAGVTRTMRVTRRGFSLRRGTSAEPSDDPATELTAEAFVLDKALAERLRAAGQRPSPRDTLYVAIAPNGAGDLTVQGEVLFAGKPSAPFELPLAAEPGLPKDAVVLVPLILVRGAAPAIAADAFAGATVIDVDEPAADGAPGHAPTLEVEALGKPRQAVTLVARSGVARGLLEGGHFDTSRCFLLPDAIPKLRGLVSWYALHPGTEVLVVGHADRSGDAAYNLTLSLERAQAVAAYLRDDVDAWLAWYDASGEKRWGTREDQHMLSLLFDGDGVFYAAEVDGVAGPGTSEAARRFQAWSNATRGTALDVDGACGPLTRRELVTVYMQQDATTLPEGTSLLTYGCGEHFPAVETADGVAEDENRRVDVMFFPDGVDPRPESDVASGPDDPHYPAWRDAIVEELSFEDRPDAFELLIRLEQPEDWDDRFELVSADGAYSRTLDVSDAEVVGTMAVLYFTDLVPGPTYALTHLPDDARRIPIFSGASYEALLAPRPVLPVYDPPAPGETPDDVPLTSGDEDFRWLPVNQQAGGAP